MGTTTVRMLSKQEKLFEYRISASNSLGPNACLRLKLVRYSAAVHGSRASRNAPAFYAGTHASRHPDAHAHHQTACVVIGGKCVRVRARACVRARARVCTTAPTPSRGTRGSLTQPPNDGHVLVVANARRAVPIAAARAGFRCARSRAAWRSPRRATASWQREAQGTSHAARRPS